MRTPPPPLSLFLQNHFIYQSYRVMENLSSEGCSFLGSKIRSFISFEFETWPRSSVSMLFSDYNRCEEEKSPVLFQEMSVRIIYLYKTICYETTFRFCFSECLLSTKRKGQLMESFCLVCLLLLVLFATGFENNCKSLLRCMNILRNDFS